MTEAEFKQELKNLSGGYLFFGGEDYLKFTYAKEVKKNVLDGTFDEFNHTVIYAEEYNAPALLNAICTLPMMSEKKLVEVRGVNFNSLKKDELSALEASLAALKENDHTVLLVRADTEYFNAGRLPKSPSELYKMMSKYLKPVEFDFPSTARLRAWILRHFTKGKIEFEQELCDYLVTSCGHDMWALSNEIDKLCSYAQMKGLSKIEAKDIDFVCCKTIEYDDFQLTNALLERNKYLALETLRRQKSAHEQGASVLASVIRLYTDMLLVQRLYSSGMSKSQIAAAINMHEFKVGKYIAGTASIPQKKLERAVELCKEADKKSKSAQNMTSYVAVERLVCAICALLCK